MLTIGIAGGTGSGKTTVARSVSRKLGNRRVNLISQDNYYLNHPDLTLKEREMMNYDHPHAFESSLLLEHIRTLSKGKSVRIPVYDFSRHERSGKTVLIEPKPVLLVEGLHVLSDETLREAMNIKVFVDTDPDVRILRRIIRDTRDRGRSLESVANQYLSTVKPMHDAFIEPSKKYADVIIPEGGHNEISINLLVQFIKKYLKE